MSLISSNVERRKSFSSVSLNSSSKNHGSRLESASFNRCQLPAIRPLMVESSLSNLIKDASISDSSLSDSSPAGSRVSYTSNRPVVRESLASKLVSRGGMSVTSGRKASSVLPSFVPKKIPGWILTSIIGRGGFAIVMYASTPADLTIDVSNPPETFEFWDANHSAVKVFDRRYLSLEKSRMQGVLREIRILKMVQSVPGVLQLRGVGETESSICIVSPCLGPSLFSLLSRGKPVSDAIARSILLSLANILFSLHSDFHVAHRDVKLENLLIPHKNSLTLPVSTPLQVINLIDFGMAVHDPPLDFTSLKSKQQSSHRRAYCGTVSYMSPELASRDGEYDAFKVDVWAYGVVAYCLLTGHMPFRSPSFANLNAQIRKGELLGKEWRQIPDDVKQFIEGILVPEPSNRPSIEEVRQMRWLQSGAMASLSEIMQYVLQNDNSQQMQHK